jgi:hypothetical protein
MFDLTMTEEKDPIDVAQARAAARGRAVGLEGSICDDVGVGTDVSPADKRFKGRRPAYLAATIAA